METKSLLKHSIRSTARLSDPPSPVTKSYKRLSLPSNSGDLKAPNSSETPRASYAKTTSSTPSATTNHPSNCSHLFRDKHGRVFNSTNEAYPLPADSAEHDRLELQHSMMYRYLGGLYPAKEIVEYLLRPGQGRTPMVLDIGAGSGAWAIDMAIKFPHCEVIGLDLVPPQLKGRTIPKNCRFEINDANYCLKNWINCFDVVHIRSTEPGIHNFEALIYDIGGTMRPDGLLIMGGGSIRFYNEWVEPYHDVAEGEEGFSWLYKLFSAVNALISKSGTYAYASSSWHGWAETNPNFKDVVSWDMLMPVGNWGTATSTGEFEANELHRDILIRLSKSFAPALISDGYDKDTIDHWVKETERELTELRLHSLSRWIWTWCRRDNNTWVPYPDD